ncbi:MAG: SprB repeat-containing protein [Novosphingobium sp.]
MSSDPTPPASTTEQIRGQLARIRDPKVRGALAARLQALDGNMLETPGGEAGMTEREALLATSQSIAEGENARWIKSILWISVVAIVALTGLIAYLYSRMSPEQLLGNAAARPVIMLAMIVAMLGFGGFLIVRSLLMEGAAEEIEAKFRMGREIFLVYSGIFATVVGFYFGALDADNERPKGVALTTSLSADGTIVADVTGGTPPYAMVLVGRDGKRVSLAADADDPARFLITPSTGVCAAEGQFEISGNNEAAYPPVTISYPVELLRSNGWKDVCTEAVGAAEPKPEEKAGSVPPEASPE